MITAPQVAVLAHGDVIRVTGWRGLTIEGPVQGGLNGLWLGEWVPIRTPEGQPPPWMSAQDAALTWVSQAPRQPRTEPVYSNHARTDYFPGDVVRIASPGGEDVCVDVFAPRHGADALPWLSLHADDFLQRHSTVEAMPLDGSSRHASLLVDGVTGQVVTS